MSNILIFQFSVEKRIFQRNREKKNEKEEEEEEMRCINVTILM